MTTEMSDLLAGVAKRVWIAAANGHVCTFSRKRQCDLLAKASAASSNDYTFSLELHFGHPNTVIALVKKGFKFRQAFFAFNRRHALEEPRELYAVES